MELEWGSKKVNTNFTPPWVKQEKFRQGQLDPCNLSCTGRQPGGRQCTQIDKKAFLLVPALPTPFNQKKVKKSPKKHGTKSVRPTGKKKRGKKLPSLVRVDYHDTDQTAFTAGRQKTIKGDTLEPKAPANSRAKKLRGGRGGGWVRGVPFFRGGAPPLGEEKIHERASTPSTRQESTTKGGERQGEEGRWRGDRKEKVSILQTEHVGRERPKLYGGEGVRKSQLGPIQKRNQKRFHARAEGNSVSYIW